MIPQTVTVCDPRLSPAYACGELQLVAVPLSSEHVVVVGDPVTVKLTDTDVVWKPAPCAGEVIVTTGGSTTVNVRQTGLPTTPVGEVARTQNWCVASLSCVYVAGLAQAAKTPPSSLHWNVEPLVSDVNATLVVCRPIVPDGPLVIVVTGGGPA